jgi:hypothetical protein
MPYNLYNLTKEEIETAIIRYISEKKNTIPTIEKQYGKAKVEKYSIRFIVEETYQKDSLTGYYKPEFKGAEITVLE